MVLKFRPEIVVWLGPLCSKKSNTNMVDAATVTVLEPEKSWPFIPCLHQEDLS